LSTPRKYRSKINPTMWGGTVSYFLGRSGMHETSELTVMCDTFHPLKLSPFEKDLDDGKYAYSWYENAQDGAGAEAAVDGDATGAGLTSHF
jgi:hypothetical protein